MDLHWTLPMSLFLGHDCTDRVLNRERFLSMTISSQLAVIEEKLYHIDSMSPASELRQCVEQLVDVVKELTEKLESEGIHLQ